MHVLIFKVTQKSQILTNKLVEEKGIVKKLINLHKSKKGRKSCIKRWMGDINTIISVLILNENGLRLSGGIRNKNVKQSQETCL